MPPVPSPPVDVLQLGPVSVSLYGACVMLGFLVWVCGTAWIWGKGGGDPVEAAWACVLAAPGALVGARLYSVATDLDAYRGDPSQVVAVAQGGLGIYGAVLGAAMTIAVFAASRRWPIATFIDCAVVFLPAGQAVGRLGNWFNQELYGGPTSLPWGVEIDPAHRLPGYETVARYQPTFLYESLWCLALGFALLWIDKRFRLVRGQLFWLYAGGYVVFRFVMEEMRIDPAHTIGPLRVNAWVSIAVFVISVTMFLVLGRRARARANSAELRAVDEPSAS